MRARQIIVPTFLFAMISTAVFAGDFERIATEGRFNALVVGKTLASHEGWGRFLPDGTIDGKFGGLAMRGGWVWHGGFVCRNVILGNRPELGTDCLVVEIGGNQLRLIRDQGHGDVVIYTIK